MSIRLNKVNQIYFQGLPERGDFCYFLFLLRLLALKIIHSKLLLAIMAAGGESLPEKEACKVERKQRQEVEVRHRILLKLDAGEPVTRLALG